MSVCVHGHQLDVTLFSLHVCDCVLLILVRPRCLVWAESIFGFHTSPPTATGTFLFSDYPLLFSDFHLLFFMYVQPLHVGAAFRKVPSKDLQRLLPPVLRRSLPHGQRSPNLWLWAVPGHDDMPWLHNEISPCPPFWALVSLWRWFSILKPSRQVSVAYRTDCSFGSRFAFCSSTMLCTYL